MSKEALVIVLGALVCLLPYTSGLPSSWYKPLLILCGLILVLLGVMLRSEALSRGDSKGTSFFVDNRAKEEQKSFTESQPKERIQ